MVGSIAVTVVSVSGKGIGIISSEGIEGAIGIGKDSSDLGGIRDGTFLPIPRPSFVSSTGIANDSNSGSRRAGEDIPVIF